jgi:hypothetical protein
LEVWTERLMLEVLRAKAGDFNQKAPAPFITKGVVDAKNTITVGTRNGVFIPSPLALLFR